MIYYLIFAIILWIILFPDSQVEHFTEETYDQWYHSVVRIEAENSKFNWIKPYDSSTYSSVGTGFFIDKQGTILTASHVVDEAIKLYISIPALGNQKFDAQVVSIYPDKDIAIIQCDNSQYQNTHFLSLGDSDKIQIGDKMLALGYPLGYSKIKVSTGVMSGYHQYHIQIDVAINQGNSGGPLLNKNHQVIGVNTSKIVRTGIDNIGFSLPINIYQVVKDRMKTQKVIYKPILGILGNNSSPDLIESYGFSSQKESGYLITEVIPYSAMDIIGVKSGDIITHINDRSVDNFGEIVLPMGNQREKWNLFNYLNYYAMGSQLKFNFITPDQTKVSKQVILNRDETMFAIRNQYPLMEKINYQVWGGICVMQLSQQHYDYFFNQDILSYLKLINRLQPVLVITNILVGSSMKKENILSSGSILKSVNGIRVTTLAEYQDAILNPIEKNGIQYLEIKTEDNSHVILKYTTLLNEESLLSEKHKYVSSGLIKKLKSRYPNISNVSSSNGNAN